MEGGRREVKGEEGRLRGKEEGGGVKGGRRKVEEEGGRWRGEGGRVEV